jgi:hypothetical protein
MTPDEEQAADRLRKELTWAREHKVPVSMVYADDIGLLLCAVGRLAYMEEHAGRLAKADGVKPEARSAARLILGWKGED